MTGDKYFTNNAGLPSRESTKSFWHSEPSSVLLGHRTTPSLPTEADVVIIGSGISGASAALRLREKSDGKKLNVVMLEAREACWGATGRNGGHCQPKLFQSSLENATFEFRNYKAIESLITTHNIPCEWISRPGCHAFFNSSMFKAAAEAVEALQARDPELGKLVSVVTKESSNPSLEDLRVPTAEGAVLQVHAAGLWPYKFISWILESLLESKDLNLQTNTPVTHLQKIQDGWAIHTPRGVLAAPTVLVATNGYTSHLIPGFNDLIVPVRGEMSALNPPKSVQPATLAKPLEYSYGFLGNGKQNINQDDYLIQRPFSTIDGEGGGHLMFGGGRSYAAGAGINVSDDSEIDPPAAAYLRRELNRVLDLQHETEELEADWEWSGIMGYSRDGHPWVGEVTPELGVGGGKGLWISGGFTGHGMPNAWLCGKAVIDLIQGSEDVDVPRGYRLDKERITSARSFDEVWLVDGKV